VLETPELLDSMARNSRRFGRPEAARAIALELLNLERSRR